jgi:hypothetical protein
VLCEKNKSDKRITFVIILLGVLVSFICILPCINADMPNGDDTVFHVLRFESVYYALKSGQGFPSYVYSQVLEGYGYGTGIFYPDIFLLPAALFRYMGASLELSIKLYIYLIMLVTCITSYTAGKYIGHSRYTGIATMILYTVGHYHLEDIYSRFAIGEVVAMAFLPLVFMALYDFTEKEHSKKGLLCVAFSLVLLSHTISFVLCVILAAIWTLIRIKRIWNKEKILGLVCEMIACMAVTSYYWLPVLEQFVSGKFKVSEEPAFYNHEETMHLFGILCGKYSVAFIEIGILVLLIALSYEKNILNKKSMCCIIWVIILLLAETNLFPWKLVDKTPLVSIQFPWRLNMFTEFFLALGIGIQIKDFNYNKVIDNRRLKQSIFICLIIGLFNLSIVWMREITGYVNYPDGYIENPENTNSIMFQEWLPVEGDISETVKSDEAGKVVLKASYETGNNQEQTVDLLEGQYTRNGKYEFDASGITGTCIIPKYYYKGYTATYISSSGTTEELQLKKDGDTGLISIDLFGCEGMVSIYYEGTFIQKITRWVSLLSMIIVVILIGISERIENHGRNNH